MAPHTRFPTVPAEVTVALIDKYSEGSLRKVVLDNLVVKV